MHCIARWSWWRFELVCEGRDSGVDIGQYISLRLRISGLIVVVVMPLLGDGFDVFYISPCQQNRLVISKMSGCNDYCLLVDC